MLWTADRSRVPPIPGVYCFYQLAGSTSNELHWHANLSALCEPDNM